MKTHFLKSNFYCNRKYYAVAKGEKQLIILLSCDTDELQIWPTRHDIHKSTISGTHGLMVSNSCLIRLEPLNRRESTPDTQNLTNFLEQVRSWILKENLLPSLFYTSMIPNYILNLNFIQTNKCRSHPFSKKLLIVA